MFVPQKVNGAKLAVSASIEFGVCFHIGRNMCPEQELDGRLWPETPSLEDATVSCEGGRTGILQPHLLRFWNLGFRDS